MICTQITRCRFRIQRDAQNPFRLSFRAVTHFPTQKKDSSPERNKPQNSKSKFLGKLTSRRFICSLSFLLARFSKSASLSLSRSAASFPPVQGMASCKEHAHRVRRYQKCCYEPDPLNPCRPSDDCDTITPMKLPCLVSSNFASCVYGLFHHSGWPSCYGVGFDSSYCHSSSPGIRRYCLRLWLPNWQCWLSWSSSISK